MGHLCSCCCSTDTTQLQTTEKKKQKQKEKEKKKQKQKKKEQKKQKQEQEQEQELQRQRQRQRQQATFEKTIHSDDEPAETQRLTDGTNGHDRQQQQQQQQQQSNIIAQTDSNTTIDSDFNSSNKSSGGGDINDKRRGKEEEEEEEEEDDDNEINDISESSSNERFKKLMQQCFWCFVGYSKYKKNMLYMQRKELSKFFELMGITQVLGIDCNNVFELMDNDIQDNKISLYEFLDYFCNPSVNPKCRELQTFLMQNRNFQILTQALDMVQLVDADKNGRLEYGEFAQLGKLMNLNSSQIETIWNQMDTDNSGDIRIDEIFVWLQNQLMEA